MANATLEFRSLQPMPKVLFKQGFHFKPSPQAIYIDLLLQCRNIDDANNFYIRMKTANDFIKHLVEIRRDMSDDYNLQAAVM